MFLKKPLTWLLLSISTTLMACQQPSGCDESDQYLVEILDLRVDPRESRPSTLKAILRLDGQPWFTTNSKPFPPGNQWAFCAPKPSDQEHELRVTLLAGDEAGASTLGAEFNPAMKGPHSTVSRLSHLAPVTLRRPKVCNNQGWCWENPWPQGATLFSTASRDRDSVWAVGDAGTILHWNGGFWQRLEVTDAGVGLGVWVDERDYAWVLVLPDKLYRCSNLECRQIGAAGSPRFAQIFGFDAEHAFAVGTNGSLYACSPTGCQQLNSTVSSDLNRGVAVSADSVYVAGAQGVLLRCRRNECARIPTRTTESLLALARGPEGTLHVTGDRGVYLVCTDLGCQARSTGTTMALDKIQVLPNGAAFLVGSEAAAVSCNPKTCQPLAIPSGVLLTGLFATAADSAWISVREVVNPVEGIYRGWVLHCNETRCNIEHVVPQYNGHLIAIGGSDADNIWAVGYLGVMVQCSEARGCQAYSQGSTKSFSAISGDAHLAWANGQDGAIVRCVEGFGCQEFSLGANSWLLGGGGSLGQHFAVGRNGAAASCNATGCQPLTTNTTHMLKSVWPIDDRRAWVAGGAQVILRCTSSSTPAAPPPPCTTIRPEDRGNANGIWGTREDNTWVVGGYTKGTVYRCSGAGCTQIHSDNVTWEFLAVSGASPDSIWAVGQVGGITRCTQSGCSEIPSGVSVQLAAVWTPAPDTAWAVGADGVIVRCQGTICRTVASGTDKYLGSIHGIGDRFWVVGHQGTLLRCSPDRCDAITKLSPSDIGPVLIPDATSGWIAGGGGAVFRYYPERAIN